MKRLYPDIGCYYSNYLHTADGSALYFEQSGNPQGIPVLYIHGGPGAGLAPHYKRFFDTNRYRVIAFEQRGCGRSKPFGSLVNNTTDHTLADINALREHLNIDQWVLFGGSWGATLALLSAIQQPHTVLALILRGTFLGRQEDREWFLGPQGGGATLFPEHYDMFIADIPEPTDCDAICRWYEQAFNQTDTNERLLALKRWYVWEERLSRLSLPPGTGDITTHYPLNLVTSLARLECHYLLNHCFIAENYILDNINQISDIPGIIVHGRYDVICPTRSAWQLHKAWKSSELDIVPDAGHSTSEPGVALRLCRATREMSRFIKGSS